jgi:hypothetical protein
VRLLRQKFEEREGDDCGGGGAVAASGRFKELLQALKTKHSEGGVRGVGLRLSNKKRFES